MRLQALTLLASLVAGCGGGSGLVPTGLTDEVAAARASLEQHWEDGLVIPAFDFVVARCRADGGLLILFRERGFGADGLAVAMQGPGAMSAAWSGGFGVVDPATDPEIQFFFRESPEVPCRG